MQVEAAGYNMIMTLMDYFGGMITQFIQKKGKLDMRNHGLYQLLPKELRENMRWKDEYGSFVILIDYISGMTDRYVLETYQRLTGASGPLQLI